MQYLLKPIFILILTGTAFCCSFGSVYQAETGDLYKAVVETKNSGYSGDAYVNFDNVPGSYLEMRIGMAGAGEQKITIRFANGSSNARPMQISLNDSVVTESVVFEPTGDWTAWDTLLVFFNFEEGINRLRFTSTGSEGGPNLDHFEISGEQLASHSINLSVTGDGNILQKPDKGMLFHGQEMVLIARPGFSHIFKEWTGDFSGPSDTLVFVLDSDKTIHAVFEKIEPEIPEPDFSLTGYASLSGDGLETTTGGEGGQIIFIETLDQLKAWGKNREENYTPETVVIEGTIEAFQTEVISIKRGGNISILGYSGSEEGFAELKNVSFHIREYSNVIIRNLKMHEVFYPDDDLTIDECHHVWIDHCEFHSKIGPGIGVDTYDGLLDIKKGSHNVTVSWCYFHDHMKTILIGHSDNNDEQDARLEVTFHHNWFSNTDGRNPSLRFGKVHYYNNYLENITDYGFAVRNGAHAKIENCHFESVNLPIATDKFTGHGFACVSGCIYTGNCIESDNRISAPFECDFWNEMIPYLYNLEDVNTVSLSVNRYAGVGKLDITTSEPVVNSLKDFELQGVYFDKNQKSLNINCITETERELSISVYTIDGRLISSAIKYCPKGRQKLRLFPGNYRPGLHLVKVQTEKGSITQKVLLL